MSALDWVLAVLAAIAVPWTLVILFADESQAEKYKLLLRDVYTGLTDGNDRTGYVGFAAIIALIMYVLGGIFFLLHMLATRQWRSTKENTRLI